MKLLYTEGPIHLSKDITTDKNNNPVFGLVAKAEGSSWGNIVPATYVKSLSQEHGVMKANPKFYSKTKIGDVIFVIPSHSCLCANNFESYQLTDGKIISRFSQSTISQA